MKNLITYLFCVIFLFALSSCSKNEITIDDLLVVDTLYTPSHNVFPELYNQNRPHVIIKSDTIFGYYYNGYQYNVFYSFDNLKSTIRNEIPYGWRIIYFDMGNIIIHRKDGASSSWAGFEIKESNDYGATFNQKIKKEWEYEEYSYTPVFYTENNGIFFTEPYSTWYSNDFEVYKIEGNSYSKISDITQNLNYLSYPKLLSFIDDSNLFFIAYGVYGSEMPSSIFHSNDGGNSWDSKLINTMPPINNYGNNEFHNNDYLEIISKTKYAFYETHLNWNGNEYLKYLDIYFTADAGVNWIQKEFDISGYITSIQFVNEYVGFILVKNSIETPSKYVDVYKSVDSGETWVQVNTKVYADEIYFADENNWIASYKNIVQITKNGGVSWDLLTY